MRYVSKTVNFLCSIGGTKRVSGIGLLLYMFGQVKLFLNNFISHPKKCKGRGGRLDLEKRNQCEYKLREEP